jgi:hypothetical protein
MVAPIASTIDLPLRLPFHDASITFLDPKSTTGPKLIKGWILFFDIMLVALCNSGALADAERSSVGADLDNLSMTGTGNTPLCVAALPSTGTKLRLQQGAVLPRLILYLVPTTECPDLLSILHSGHLCPSRLSSLCLYLGCLCSSRLSSLDHGPPSAAPSTPFFIPLFPTTVSAKSTPGVAKATSDAPLQVLKETSDASLQVITAPPTSAGTTPRSLSAEHDSTAPDSALPYALSSSRVRSSGTGHPDLLQFFFWNALFSRPIACPTSRTMSFHPTRRIFVSIASPATTTVLHLSSLQRWSHFVSSGAPLPIAIFSFGMLCSVDL